MHSIGPYQVEEEISRGGMGAVFRARDPQGREVAIKLLLDAQAAAPVARKRFLREIEALTRLDHPNVVPFLATGEHQETPFLVMELIEGRSLQQRIEEEGPLPVREAVDMARKLALGLAHAHREAVLHRDVKPDNVVISSQGEPFLTDFGLAKDLTAEQSRLTRTGAFLGTPGFWAPEQARGETHVISPATDVFGLGATLYAALTGQPPHGGESFQALLDAARSQAPTLPSRLRPEVDADLEQICLRCLAKAPERRYSSARDLADALEGYLFRAPKGPGPGRPIVAGTAIGIVAAVAILALALRADEQARPPPDPEPTGTTQPRAGPRPVAPILEEGLAAYRSGDDPTAQEHANRALRIDPRSTSAYLLLGLSYNRLGRLHEARQAYERANALEPGHPGALALRGLLRVSGGDYDGALVDFDQALSRDPNLGVAHQGYGTIFLARGDYPRAEDAYDRGVAVGHDPPEVLYCRGMCRHMRGNLGGALEDYEEALGRIPASRSGLQGVLRKLIAEAKAGGRSGVEAHLWINRGSELQRGGDLRNAMDAFTRAIDADPHSASAYRFRAELRRDTGDLPGSLEDLTRAIETSPDAPDLAILYNNRGAIRFRLDDPQGALADYTRGIELGYTDGHFNRAQLRHKTGDLTGARADYDRYLSVHPDSPDTLVNRAQVLIQLGDPAGARRDVDRAIELDPGHALAHTTRAMLRGNTGDQTGAIADYDRAIELAPDDHEPLIQRGMLQLKMGDVPAALASLEQAVELAPDSPRARVSRGMALEGSGQPARAAADYRRALQLLPPDDEIRQVAADGLARTQR